MGGGGKVSREEKVEEKIMTGLHAATILLAVVLAIRCTAKAELWEKVATIGAGYFFPEIYLAQYFVRRVLIEDPCPGAFL